MHFPPFALWIDEFLRFQFAGLIFDFRILTFHPTDIEMCAVHLQSWEPEQPEMGNSAELK